MIRRIAAKLRRVPRRIGYVTGPRIMSRLRKWWVLARHPHADIRFTEPVYLGPGFSLHIPDGGTFVVGPGTEFRRNFRAEIVDGGKIVIGTACYLTYDVIIACSTVIEIGDRVGLGQATFLADGHHRYRDLSKPFLAQGFDLTPIKIEDDVQVHSKVTIGANIGKRAVIGANAMVTRDIPAYCLAAGVPARVLDYFGPEGAEPPELARGSSGGEGAASG